MLALPTVKQMPEKSTPPMIMPMIGVIMSLTRELMIAVKVLPMMIPTAIVMTLPFEINSLNSLKNFFIRMCLRL